MNEQLTRQKHIGNIVEEPNELSQWTATEYLTLAASVQQLYDERYTLWLSPNLCYRQVYLYCLNNAAEFARIELHFFLNNDVVLRIPYSSTTSTVGLPAHMRQITFLGDNVSGNYTHPMAALLRLTTVTTTIRGFPYWVKADHVKLWIAQRAGSGGTDVIYAILSQIRQI